jgi:tripartite-type tricarboxylate transporter receptor subunit TctC
MTHAGRALIVALLGLAGLATSTLAQTYPNRPVRIIVPTPAGGPVDEMARVLANALPAFLGQNVIVENRAGAGNTLGSRTAAAAEPDGYTLLASAASGLIMSPMIYKTAGYDETSFAPIALVTETPQVLVAHPAAPFATVGDLIAYAKANPGKLNYSTGGAGTLPHLTAELFKQITGTDIVHVPYKGGGPGSDRRRRRAGATYLRHARHVAAIDPRRQPQAARGLQSNAPSRVAGCARHAGAWASVYQFRRLGGVAGAARHAGRDHRAAQPRHQ